MSPETSPGENNAWMVRTPCCVFFALTPIFIIIRFWNRLTRQSVIGWDDYTIVAAFVFTLIVESLMMVACEYGFGRHIKTLAPEDKLMALKLFYVAQIFYKFTVNLTKISILFLYLRIFIQKWFQVCCYTLIGIITTCMLAATAVSIWQCSPVSGAWDRMQTPQPKCISLTKNWFANASFSIATDVVILILPMRPLWTSKLPVVQKRALMAVFALGGFMTVTSILRATTLNFSTKSPDTTHDITSTLWTLIEPNIAIICACLPMCRPPLEMLFPSIISTKSLSSSVRHDSPEHSQGPASPGLNVHTRTRKIMESSQISSVGHDSASEEYMLDSTHSNGVVPSSSAGPAWEPTQYEVDLNDGKNWV